MRLPFLLLTAAALAAAGCDARESAALASGTAEPPTVAGVARDYKTQRSMTPSPVFVDPALAMLCRGASRQEVEAARKRSGPHAHTRIAVYMNGPAASAFKKGSASFPEGSVIVKEKKGLFYRDGDGKGDHTRDSVGGMIKRPAGFDPEHGDWEYFYFEDESRIESGKIASCVQCHAGAAGTDHVFGSWGKARE